MLASKVAFVTVRVDVAARYVDVERPTHLRLVLDGSPRGLSGSFHVEIPVDLAGTDDGGSELAYSMTIEVDGSLKAIAGPAIEQALRREFAEALVRLDERYASGEAGTPD